MYYTSVPLLDIHDTLNSNLTELPFKIQPYINISACYLLPHNWILSVYLCNISSEKPITWINRLLQAPYFLNTGFASLWASSTRHDHKGLPQANKIKLQTELEDKVKFSEATGQTESFVRQMPKWRTELERQVTDNTFSVEVTNYSLGHTKYGTQGPPNRFFSLDSRAFRLALSATNY